AHDAADHQGDAQQQGERGGGHQGIEPADDAGGDIEHAEQQPQRELAPVLDVEGGDDLGHAGHDHHDSDDIDRGHGGHHDAPQRNHARDHEDDAERHDPPPLGVQRLQTFAQAV